MNKRLLIMCLIVLIVSSLSFNIHLNASSTSIVCPEDFVVDVGKSKVIGVKVKGSYIKDLGVKSSNNKNATAKIISLDEKYYIEITGKKETSKNIAITIKKNKIRVQCPIKVNKKNTQTQAENDAESVVNMGITDLSQSNIEINTTSNTTNKSVKIVKCPKNVPTVRVGETVTIKYTISPNDAIKDNLDVIVRADGSKKKIKIISTPNPLVVKGIKKGTSKVVIKQNGKKLKICKVKVIGKSENSEKTKNNYKKLNPNAVKKITISGVSSMKKGEKKTLIANVSPSRANQNVIWKSSDKSVAKVDKNGQVTAKKKGTAIITATSKDNNSIKGSKKIKIKSNFQINKYGNSAEIESISIPETKKITVDSKKKLKVLYNPKNSIKGVKFKSSNNNIVTVDSDGKITGHKTGVAIITATYYNNDAITSKCVVTVEEKENVKKVKMNPKKMTVVIGDIKKLKPEIEPSTVYNKNVTYKSSDKNIVSVNKKGEIRAKTKGNATITITSRSDATKYAKVNINVKVGDKIYKTLSSSSFKKVVNISPTTSSYIAQSFSIVNKYYVCALVNKNDSSTTLQIYEKNTGKLVNTIKDDFYHANGMTYNNKKNEIYIAHMDNGKYSVLDGEGIEKRSYSNKIEDEVSKSISSIAYDKHTDEYYMGKGGKIYVYDSNLKYKKKIKKFITNTPQDVGAYKGLILSIAYNQSKDINAIDVYRSENKEYLGRYIIELPGELESIAYDESKKNFALYLYNGHGGEIYTTTKLNLNKYVN